MEYFFTYRQYQGDPEFSELMTVSEHESEINEYNQASDLALADAIATSRAGGIAEGGSEVANDPASYCLVPFSSYQEELLEMVKLLKMS